MRYFRALGPSFLWVFVGLLAAAGLRADPMVLHEFHSVEPDSRLENLLYLSAAAELAEAGVSSTRDKGDPAYRLRTGYEVQERDVAVHYRLTPGEERQEILAELHVEGEIDVDLDRRVARAIRELLERAEIDPDPSREAVIEGLFAARPVDPDEREPHRDEVLPDEASGRLQRRTPEPSEPEAAEAELVKPELAELEPEPESDPDMESEPDIEADDERTRGFEIAPAAGGAFVVGEAAELFRYGAVGALTLGVTRGGSGPRLMYGGRVSVSRVFADRGVSGPPLYLTGIGPEVRVLTSPRSPIRGWGRATAGGALVALRTSEGTPTKMVPFADAGVGARVAIGDRFAIGGEVGFAAFFDDETVIMGVSPTVALGVEL